MGKPVSKANADHYVWGEGCDGWHLLKHPELSVIQERMPAGTAEVRHYHEKARQFFYVLEGRATLRIAADSVALDAGEGLEVAPGVPHQFRNDSGLEVVFLVISSPWSHGDRRDLG